MVVVGYYGFMLVVLCPCVFLLPDSNLSKDQLIFNKFGMCIAIVEIWFGIANGQSPSIFDKLIACHMIVMGYY